MAQRVWVRSYITTLRSALSHNTIHSSHSTVRYLSSGRPIEVFDRDLKRRQRDAMAKLDLTGEYDYIRKEVAARLIDRFRDITREFPYALDLGAHTGHLYREICAAENPGNIEHLIQMDISAMALNRCEDDARLQTTKILGDEEDIPFEPHTFDLVLSSLSLQWVNDVPSTLRQIRDVLKPDGAFMGAIIGGNTLHELQHCLYLAELEREGGVSNHTSPFIQPSDVGPLLQGAGFALPTIDVDTIQVGYADMFTLLEHVQNMGEAHAAHRRRGRVSRDTLLSAAALYQHMYGDGSQEGGIGASLQVIYMIGWSPHTSQPQPLARGSGKVSMKEVLERKKV